MKNNTINKKEIEKFSKIAEEWWNPEGKFKPLHKFNPIRISYIKENIIKTFKLDYNKTPLKNIKILDIGCGGGLLSEPMCRLGAKVTGIDASEKNIKVAKLHSKKPYKEAIKEMYEFATYMELAEEKLNSLINLYNESRDFYTKSPEGLSDFYLENKKVSNKVASLAIVASAIMNLDEFLTHG